MTLNAFKDKYLGKQVEFHSFGSGAQFQCVDSVNQYIKDVLNKTPIIGTNAKDFGTKFNKAEFDWIINTPDAIIEVGDIPVWNGNVGGGAGHIAIATQKGTLSSFKSLDQNWSQKERVTLETHDYLNVTGWLRAKGGVNVDTQKIIDELRTARDKNWDLYQNQIKKTQSLETEIDVLDEVIKTTQEKLKACESKPVPDIEVTRTLAELKAVLKKILGI